MLAAQLRIYIYTEKPPPPLNVIHNQVNIKKHQEVDESPPPPPTFSKDSGIGQNMCPPMMSIPYAYTLCRQ